MPDKSLSVALGRRINGQLGKYIYICSDGKTAHTAQMVKWVMNCA